MGRAPTRQSAAVPRIGLADHEQRTRELAYRLWEGDGKMHGRDLEYWGRARDLIDSQGAAGNASPKPLHAPKRRPRVKPKTSI